MRMPIRLHVYWKDENTLVMESDHGQQVRELYFDGPHWQPGDELTWQGDSVASWERNSLKVVTTNMKLGYVRRNGVPYSEDAVVTEYFDFHREVNGEWFTVTSEVADDRYMRIPYISNTSFRKLPNGDKWNPSECISEWGTLREGPKRVPRGRLQQ